MLPPVLPQATSVQLTNKSVHHWLRHEEASSCCCRFTTTMETTIVAQKEVTVYNGRSDQLGLQKSVYKINSSYGPGHPLCVYCTLRVYCTVGRGFRLPTLLLLLQPLLQLLLLVPAFLVRVAPCLFHNRWRFRDLASV